MLQIQPIKSPIDQPILVSDPIKENNISSSGQIKVSGFIDKAVNVVDKVTNLPGRVSQTANNINDDLISFFNKFKRDASIRIEDNLKTQKASSLGSKAGIWLSKGNNMIIAGAILAGILLFIFRGK